MRDRMKVTRGAEGSDFLISLFWGLFCDSVTSCRRSWMSCWRRGFPCSGRTSSGLSGRASSSRRRYDVTLRSGLRHTGVRGGSILRR